jgi:Ser/Thr protein kinase RdoA (MazF antagonist)
MNGSPFPVQRSLLSTSALAEWLSANYNLSTPTTFQFWRRGINDLYLAKADGIKFVLRISPANWRSVEQLAAEIDLLSFLRRCQLIVPEPIRHKDGTCIQTLNAPEGPRHAVVFSFVPGVPSSPSEVQAHRFGQAIAQLHAITDRYPPGRAGLRFEPTDMIDRPLTLLRPLFAEHPDDWDYLREIGGGLKQTAGRLPRNAPEYGICHGDVNDANFHIIDDDKWALLDFEYFGYGWRLFDIATFYSNQIYQQGRTGRTRRILEAFLEGYQSVRALSQTELGALPSFVILRQIWLMGIGARNQPIIGLSLFESWVFDRCLPFIRAWMAGGFGDRVA